MWGTHPKNIEAAVGKRIPVDITAMIAIFQILFSHFPRMGTLMFSMKYLIIH